MPKSNIYSVRDMKVGSYGPLVQFRNDAEATRAFGDMITNGGDNIIAKHPSDFALYRLGTFNVEEGIIEFDIGKVDKIVDGNSFDVKGE